MASDEILAHYNFRRLLSFFWRLIDKHDSECQLRVVYCLAVESAGVLDKYRQLLRKDYDGAGTGNSVLERYLFLTVKDLYWQSVSYVSKKRKWVVDFDGKELEEFFGWLISKIEEVVAFYLDSIDDHYRIKYLESVNEFLIRNLQFVYSNEPIAVS